MRHCQLQTCFRSTAIIGSGIAAALILHFLPANVSAEDRFQASVNEMMKGTGGAAVASDPRTGRILAIWNRQVIFERRFPPGSTAKLVTGAVALENHLIASDEKLYCRRVPRLLGEAYRDDNRLERAKEAYRDAVRIDPEFSPAWAGLAGVLARTGPRVEFEEAIKQLMRLEPELAKQILSGAKRTR